MRIDVAERRLREVQAQLKRERQRRLAQFDELQACRQARSVLVRALRDVIGSIRENSDILSMDIARHAEDALRKAHLGGE